MREYSILAVISVVGVLALEFVWLRTGLLRDATYWIAMGICFAFMLLVDGWLTKSSATIVFYDPDRITGWRAPWDIPVEDYLFGFSMLTLAMLTWDHLGQRARPSRATGESGRRASERRT